MTKQLALDWRDELLELAGLVDDLVRDQNNPEASHIQQTVLAHELRRLANRDGRREPKMPFGWRI